MYGYCKLELDLPHKLHTGIKKKSKECQMTVTGNSGCQIWQ